MQKAQQNTCNKTRTDFLKNFLSPCEFGGFVYEIGDCEIHNRAIATSAPKTWEGQEIVFAK